MLYYESIKTRPNGRGGAFLSFPASFRSCRLSFSNVLEDTTALNFVWDVADTLNGMMAIPNLIALLGLSGVVAKTTRDYFKDKKDQNAPFPEEA